jgi:hypothetical protein
VIIPTQSERGWHAGKGTHHMDRSCAEAVLKVDIGVFREEELDKRDVPASGLTVKPKLLGARAAGGSHPL